jgi:hypothetical protein
MINLILGFALGTFFGMLLLHKVTSIRDKKAKEKIVNDIVRNYNEVYNNILLSNCNFKSRVNNIAYISSSLVDHGDVEIIYILDKIDIAIFKDGKCIYTSDLVNKELVLKITSLVEHKYQKELNDVVSILGMTFSKDIFEKTFKIKYDDIKDQLGGFDENSNKSEIDKIVSENEYRYNIDEILDKIGKDGIQKLTPEEKKFLDNYSKNG